jgi:Na+-translocating ferredoxin:NAD+ oxidoreductase RnfD subunit
MYLSFIHIIILLLFSFLVEHLFIYIKEQKVTYFSSSALTTSLGVILMMVTPHLWIYMLVITLGLAQKHLITYKYQHLFNPSNFALIATLVFFYQDAHIVLGQLGDDLWLAMAVIILGSVILWKASRWIISLSFIIGYLLFQYIGIVQNDPILHFEDITERFYSVSFIVFTLFMLTDPRTTPSKPLYQLLFGIGIAWGVSIMDYYYGFRVQHLFMVLFVLTPASIFLHSYRYKKENHSLTLFALVLLSLVVSAIIYIEIQPPYYFTMDG